MGLELLAASLALSSFEHLIKDKRVVLHCDNTGGEVDVCLLIVRYRMFILLSYVSGGHEKRDGAGFRPRAVSSCAVVAHHWVEHTDFCQAGSQ